MISVIPYCFIWNYTCVKQIVAWLKAQFCNESSRLIKWVQFYYKASKPKRVNLRNLTWPGDLKLLHEIEVVQNDVDKLKRSGFGSIPAGYHETCDTEKEHEWYAFST